MIPDFKDKAFGRVPAYDFSTDSIYTKDPFKESEWKESVTYDKPKDYANISSEPKNFFDLEEYTKTLQ